MSAPSEAVDDTSVAPLVQAVRDAATALELLRATQALAEQGHPAAAPCLVEVLGFNNPGAAVAAVEGLIALGSAAVEPILRDLDGYNYGARAWAVRALAGIGDVRGLEVLEEALGQDIGPSVRRAAARGLGQLRLDSLEADAREGVEERCLQALEAGGGDGEWVVRYAVVVGLHSLGGALEPGSERLERVQKALTSRAHPQQEAVPVVRLRAERGLTLLEGLHG
ncbi:MAG: HEAT repeat domain-containing protein [Prochlorococcaceae cyanobacterium]|jgi:phycocyanobilin lyase beta subunit